MFGIVPGRCLWGGWLLCGWESLGKMNGAQTPSVLDRRHNLPHGVYQTVRYTNLPGTPWLYRSARAAERAPSKTPTPPTPTLPIAASAHNPNTGTDSSIHPRAVRTGTGTGRAGVSRRSRRRTKLRKKLITSTFSRSVFTRALWNDRDSQKTIHWERNIRPKRNSNKTN